MADSLFIDGKLHAPYFIFIRNVGTHTDTDLLKRFGLSTYRRTRSPRRLRSYAILANDDQWTMLADDWGYTLWHMSSTRPVIQQLGKTFDLFACSVGDCDESLDFVYFQSGQLVRQFALHDPGFGGKKVVESTGLLLPGEAIAFRQSDITRIVLGVAASLGMKTNYLPGDVRVYAPLVDSKTH